MMIAPAASGPSLPCKRISRVDATFNESLKRVSIRSREGKILKSSGFWVYMVVISTTTAREIFRARKKSRIMGCKGRIIAMRMPIKARTIRISDDSFFIVAMIPTFSAAIYPPYCLLIDT